MLSKEEQEVLNALLSVIEDSKERSTVLRLSYYDMEWLAKKLKETNDELSKLKKEIRDQCPNGMSDGWGHLGGPDCTYRSEKLVSEVLEPCKHAETYENYLVRICLHCHKELEVFHK